MRLIERPDFGSQSNPTGYQDRRQVPAVMVPGLGNWNRRTGIHILHSPGARQVQLAPPNPGRFARNGGLSSGWEDYMYLDTYQEDDNQYVKPSNQPQSSDAGGNWFDSLLTGVSALGTTYLQTEAQKKAAKEALKYRNPGTTTTVTPGGVYQTTAGPVSSGLNLTALLSNPLVLGAIGVGAYLLFKKKR